MNRITMTIAGAALLMVGAVTGLVGATGIDKDKLQKELFRAIDSGNLEDVKKSIKQGADVNAEDTTSGLYALEIALDNNNVEIIKYLIESGADINAKNMSGDSPLETAIKNNNIEIVKLLIAKGADINAKNKYGQPMANIARTQNDLIIFKYLVSRGGAVDIKALDTVWLEKAIKKNDFELTTLLVKLGIKMDPTIGAHNQYLALATAHTYVEDYCNNIL